jgi:hypothetical protein
MDTLSRHERAVLRKIARMGGLKKSDKKTAACRANAKKKRKKQEAKTENV